MKLKEILEQAIAEQASDVFIVAGLPVSFRRNGIINRVNDTKLFPPDTESLLNEIYQEAGNRDLNILHNAGDDDFSFAIQGLSRFRVSAYKQRGALSAVIRIITFHLPDAHELGIPDYVIHLGDGGKGMILVTGPAGSGKSTTLACMIDQINRNQQKHIITLEDPLEFLHRHECSIVSQREINVDTESYVTALRAALRQSPDVILLGEMRDYETINVAMTAAETGHLLLSTLHTIGAANTIDRIIDVFPANQQRQIAVQLSTVLTAVVSQQLVPTVDGGVVPALEIMTVTPAIRNMIRDNKVPQIEGLIYSSTKEDMISMDGSLLNLCKKGIISRDTALKLSLIHISIRVVTEHHRIHNDYHIILLDWKLPDMDGIETARELRKQLGDDVPIILISAYDWTEIEEEARAAGINGFLMKPLFRSTLFYSLRTFIDNDKPLPVHEEDMPNFANRRILVAEDNELNWEIACELLQDLGLELEWAENGQVCTDMFRKSEPGYYDAILMDIRMPIMNGYEATEAIRAMERSDASLPIIAMTADAFSEDIQRCLEHGMNAHIAKPIDVKDVGRVLKRYLED